MQKSLINKNKRKNPEKASKITSKTAFSKKSKNIEGEQCRFAIETIFVKYAEKQTIVNIKAIKATQCI